MLAATLIGTVQPAVMAEPEAQSPTCRLLLSSRAETERLAARLAGQARAGDIIGLSGSLGAGKTTFARAFVRAWTGSAGEEVPSPTFTLVQTYEAEGGAVWHFDLYRLTSPDEAYELGIEEAWSDGISLIEWPERLGAAMPSDRLDIRFAMHAEPEARWMTASAHGARAMALLHALQGARSSDATDVS